MSGGTRKPVAPALCAALLAAACGNGGSHYAGGRGGVVVAGGTLIVDWTVDGLKRRAHDAHRLPRGFVLVDGVNRATTGARGGTSG